MKQIKLIMKRVLRPVSSRWVYRARRGITKGLRRRGGFDFLPWGKHAKEESILSLLAPTLKGKVVYDIGANNGLTTIFFAHQVGEEGRVVAFEPVPFLYNWLCDHVRLNNFRNVVCLQLALGATRRNLEILYSRDYLGIGTLDPSIAERYKKQTKLERTTVQVVPLDECIVEYDLPLPDLLKIDVEGFEAEVLKGASKVLESGTPIMLEVHGQQGPLVSEILEQYGYAIYVSTQTGFQKQRICDAKTNTFFCTPEKPITREARNEC